jgi:hypothetical protein
MYARSGTVPGERLHTEGTDMFRRTRIRRDAAELAVAGAGLGAEARTATSPGLDLYPNPEPGICARCSYRSPCLALNHGGDATAELLRSYRPRPAEPVQEGRLSIPDTAPDLPLRDWPSPAFWMQNAVRRAELQRSASRTQ